jgi:dynein heavy chain, axonemal
MSEEFCYMNRRSNPYDWQIVEFDKRNPKEYMVISKRGLTKYLNNEVDFMKFEQFLEEQKVFHSLNRIDYFRLYTRKKYFAIWKKYTSMVIFKERSKEFAEETLLSDLHIKEAILEARRICRKIENIETFYCQTISAMPIDDFHLYVENEKSKTVGKIRSIESALLEMLREKIEVSMNLYMKKMRIASDQATASERKIPLLIGDETGKEMPYTKEATIRTHQLRVRNMLKLVDYLAITVKTQLLLNMTDFLTHTIRDITESYQEEKKGFSSNSWITINLLEHDGMLMFSPDETVFLEELEDIVMGTLADTCASHSQLLHAQEFEEYWKCKIDSERSDEFIDLKKIIENNRNFNEKFSDFKCTIKNSFGLAIAYSGSFERSLDYLKYMRSLEQLDFGEQNVDFFREVMSRSKEEMGRLADVEKVKEIGIVSLNCAGYKQVVEKTSEGLNIRIHSNIPSILQSRAEQLLRDIRDNYDLIAFNPLTIQEYIAFLKDTLMVTEYFENTQPLISDNSELLILSESYNIKIPEHIRSLIGEANGQMMGLSRRLSEIDKNSNELSEKFKKEI